MATPPKNGMQLPEKKGYSGGGFVFSCETALVGRIARLADGKGDVAVLDHVLDLTTHWQMISIRVPKKLPTKPIGEKCNLLVSPNRINQ
jgi:hypothetical protein